MGLWRKFFQLETKLSPIKILFDEGQKKFFIHPSPHPSPHPLEQKNSHNCCFLQIFDDNMQMRFLFKVTKSLSSKIFLK